MDCVLCDSLTTDWDRIVHQNEHVFVLVNIEPIKDGHVMILPVRHVEDLKDLTAEESKSFLKTIDDCMAAVLGAYNETPMCLINGWKHRSQPHLHAHVVPSKNSLRGLYSKSEGLEERKRADTQTLKTTGERLKPFFK